MSDHIVRSHTVGVLPMPLLSRKAVLAIAAVLDIALHSRGQTVSAKALAARHGLPPRHLEPVLQALVHQGILRGVRGPRGGYELARERRRITAEEILRAAGAADEAEAGHAMGSTLLDDIVMPMLAQAERAFLTALGKINVDDLARKAEASPGPRN